jgi:ABC-type nitrate/sulfonate/bicarbonate transport system ATPase subunit
MAAKIEVRGVGKSYTRDDGTLRVIDDVSFTVADGEFLAMVGPSGCGKTTLLHIMAGLARADGGTVAIDGVPVTAPSPKRILISQQGSVFPWLTVRGNIMFGLTGDHDAKAAVADRYAALVGLQGFERSMPHELSGGMLRRVEIARALAVRPEILYMDEPLAALDALTSLQMRFELLRILAEERHTCVLITHDVEEAIHLADRVMVLSPRPAAIQATFEIGLPRPRDLASPEAARLKGAILRELGL